MVVRYEEEIELYGTTRESRDGQNLGGSKESAGILIITYWTVGTHLFLIR